SRSYCSILFYVTHPSPISTLLPYTTLFRSHVGKTAVDVAVQDRLLVVAVLRQTLDLFPLDRQRTLVLVDAVAVEHADLDDRALHARRHPQRGVTHVRGFLAEDGAEQLLFRRHRALALRRDLADQDVAAAP